MDKKRSYDSSRASAKSNGELSLWQESHDHDVGCAGALSSMLDAGGGVAEDAARRAIDEYGYDRVNRVLANSIQRRKEEPGLDPELIQWARGFFIPKEQYRSKDVRLDYVVRKATPEQLNALVRQARACYEALGLFQHTDCIQGQDLKDRVVALKPGFLNNEFKRPEYQLVLATGGFGCSPTAGGRKVFGTFLKDGEDTGFVSGDFMGILKPELLPEWAKRNLAQIAMAHNRGVPEPRYYAVTIMADGEGIGPVNLRDEQDALTFLNRQKDYQDRLDIRQMDGACLVTVEHGAVTYAAEGALRERLEQAGLLDQEQGGMTPSM